MIYPAPAAGCAVWRYRATEDARVAERLYNTYQVASLLGVTPGTVSQWIRNGQLEFQTVGDNQVRISQEQLVAFLKARGLDVEEVIAKATLEPQTPEPAPASEPQPSAPTPDGHVVSPIEELAAEVTRQTQRAAAPTPTPIESAEPPSQPPPPDRPIDQPAAPAVEQTPKPTSTAPPAEPHVAKAAPPSGEQLLESLIRDALGCGASHVHFLPAGQRAKVQLRAEGLLQDAADILDLPRVGQLVEIIKSRAGVDSSVTNRAQAGRFAVEYQGRRIDLQVSTCPTTQGELMVVRILDPKALAPQLGELGLASENLQELTDLLQVGSGLLVFAARSPSVSLPTQYAALRSASRPGRASMVVAKDPAASVETVLARLDPAGGFTLTEATQAALLADADTILISELRDPKVLPSLIEAALDDKLILLGIRATCAAGALETLLNDAADRAALAAALQVVIVQARLAELCSNCKAQAQPDSRILRRLGVDADAVGQAVFEPVGCNQCGQSGYKGGFNVFSILRPDAQLRAAIRRGDPLEAVLQGRSPQAPLEEALDQVRAGRTCLVQVARALSL